MQIADNQAHLLSSGYAIGIDIGGTSTKIARVTPRGDVVDLSLEPDRIAIAGGVSLARSLLLDRARETFRSLCGRAYSQHVDILVSRLGWRAVLDGSAIPILRIGKEGILHSK
jgi:predicted NBD/HSP70 family sugar kinase